jgi:hypothetical protein
MKYFYIIDNYFQDALYGGIINVIASGNRECCKILEQFCPKNIDNHRIFEHVEKAKRFALANSYEKSRIIADFIA